jgi:fatty-acyl-CoA synthase
MTNATIEQRREALASRFPTWVPRSLDQLLADGATEHPDHPLVITDERTWSYADIDAWATRLADGLAARGVQPGDHVAVVLANYPEFIPLKFAIARAGAVCVPLNFLYRRAELAYVLAQSRARTLVTMDRFGGLDYLQMLAEIAEDERTRLTELSDVIVIPVGGTDERDRTTLTDIDALGAAQPAAAAGRRAKPDATGDILYTSGTTGSPKGVVVTHDAVLRTAYGSALTRAFGDGRRILFSLPCYHMFGYVEGLLAAMFVGGAIIPQTSFDPGAYLRGIERHCADDILCVPTMTVAILEHRERAERNLSSLGAILSGAAPAPVWLWEQVRDRLGINEITTGYGMTECGGAMTLTLPEDPLERHSTTVGRVKLAGVAGLPGGALCEYRTVDPLTGELLPEHTEGELVSRGPTHMLGYWDKPDETAATLRGGWLHSGDLGRLGPDGYLQITGRSKELYKSGGELVMPKEVEELLSAIPGISQVYVAGIPDERWGEAGCAWVVRDDSAAGRNLTAVDVMDVCRSKLARFKVPKEVRFITADQLPTTPTGKVQKFRLVAERVGAR